MVVILKSLFPACLFNIVGFGSTFKALFSASQPYDEETVAAACEHVRRIRADMGGTDILAPLSWILQQPVQRGHPRLLFLLTDGGASDTGKVLQLARSHARFTRCYTFGIGPNACRRLVEGLASVSNGSSEFLAVGERLQPKMIKSLKKSMCPVLSDISIDWLYPETKEVLLSPVGNTFLFPGDRLIGYSVVCDTTRYHENPKSDKRRRYSMMRSNESASSVFYHSQEEDTTGGQRDTQTVPLFDRYQDTMSESSPLAMEQDTTGVDLKTSHRRRAYSTNQIVDYAPAKRGHTPSDPSSLVGKNPLRRAKVQELIGQMSPEHGSQWRLNYQPQLASLCAASSRGPSSVCQRSPARQEGAAEEAEPDTHPALETGSSTDSPSLSSSGDADGYSHQLCEAETPQEPLLPAGQGRCKAVVSGLLCGKPVKWEVTFDMEPHLNGREREEKVHEDLWNETLHHLAGRSIIQDFEQMAGRESDVERGSGRRYQLYAIHTSKACNILSKYTAFVPIDLDSNEYLPTYIEYLNLGDESKRGSHCSSRSGSRKSRIYSVGLGRSQSGCTSESEDVAPPANAEDTPSPCSTPSSSGWNNCSFTEAFQKSPSVTSEHSQRSMESLFSARLNLTRTKLLTKAARGFMCRTPAKSSDSSSDGENDNKDYVPLASLQLASGAFVLDVALCEAINVPMDKLKWTSPFTRHRVSLSQLSHSSSRRTNCHTGDQTHDPPSEDQEELTVSRHNASLKSPSPGTDPQFPNEPSTALLGDGSRASEPEASGTPGKPEPEGMVWATAVALAWLEHSSASYFIEWELAAAKASMWLDAQSVPEGRDLAAVKAAANQLFIILRHWDENLQLNMLCYNPNSV